MQMKLEGNLYLFQCEQCKGVLSSPVPDVTGYNNTMLTTTGLLKRLSGKKNGVIYLRVYDAGNNADFATRLERNTLWRKLTKWLRKKAALLTKAEDSIDV